MHALLRLAVPAVLIAIFLAFATVALDRPGYYYDEVIFVPVSLRTLGQCDVDAAVTRQWGCFPLMQTLGYVGAVKAWLHAPIFAAFGINTWTVRLPSILLGAVALAVLWSFARRELGGAWALLLLALLVTDPVLTSHARLDWGPQMIATLMRVTTLTALWRWLQTGRMHWLALACGAMLVGFVDKLNFLWVIGALAGAALLAGGRLLRDRLRDGAPWQPALAGVTVALLLWGTATLVRHAVQLDTLGNGGNLTASGQLAKVWDLYAATFSGTAVLNWVFGTEAVISAAFDVLAAVQVAVAAVLLARWRPWTPARRLLAYLTLALVLLVAAIALTPQVGGTHHLFMVWPLPTLHLVTLLAIAAQHAGDPAHEHRRGLRVFGATTGAIVCGALLAWNIAWQFRYIDAWNNDNDYRAGFDTAIKRLAARIDKLAVDRVVSVDWGLHQQLVTLADRQRAADYREWTWRLIDAPDLERPDLREAVARTLPGRRVAFVLHSPDFTVFAGAAGRLDALLAREPPCLRTDETLVNAAGRPLYIVVVADYRYCTPAPRG